MNLKKNTVLITGGTSGIGLELGKELLKRDNTVILLGRDKSKLDSLKKDGFETIRCDLDKQEDIEETALLVQNRYPDLNMLFNNAGVQYNYSFTDAVIPLEKIGREIAINLTGQIILTQMLIPILSNKGASFIINTTSGLGAFPKSDALVYSASKAAMRNFTRGLRFSLRPSRIKVLEFIPPVTATEMTAKRSETKMPAERLIALILPKLKKEKKLLTIPKMKLFLIIAALLPGLAHRILEKK